jgi:hypothetical protein
MIWRSIRYFLIVASGAALFWLLRQIEKNPKAEPFWGADVIVPASFALNIVYLLFGDGTGAIPKRIARLASLWLDAKEAELRRRGRE